MYYFNYLLDIPVSLKAVSSLQIFENSADGIVTIEPYSVSGIPSYSLSSVRRFKLNSDTLSPSNKIFLIKKWVF